VRPTSLLVTDNWTTFSSDINDFRRLGIFGRLQAQVKKNTSPTKLAFKSQFGRFDVVSRHKAHRIRLKVGQELQNVEIEARPDRFAIFFTADDLLDGGKRPNLPSIVALVGFDVSEADLHCRRVPLPAGDDFGLKFFKPFLGHGSAPWA